MLDLLRAAAIVAKSDDPCDKRNFVLGAVGIRKDGVLVSAKNGAVISSTYDDYRVIAEAHAEFRTIRKLGKNAPALYVARVLKRDGSLAMSMPCGGCQLRIRAAKVGRVYYTINDKQYGVWDVANDHHQVYSAQ
jgi:tRNA(Arg) A34 adenosine deaminase TadA